MTNTGKDFVKEIRKDIDRISSVRSFLKKDKLISDLLNNYDESKRDFIRKYAQTKMTVLSSKQTNASYIFGLIAVVYAVAIINSPSSKSDIIFFNISIILLILLVFLLIWTLFFQKDALVSLIVAIDEDNLIKIMESELIKDEPSLTQDK